MKLLGIVSVVVLLASAACVQETTDNATGTLNGAAVDSSGAVIPGVKVTLTKTSKKIKDALIIDQRTTNQHGPFTFQAPPGFYGLIVEKKKFKIAHVRAIEIVAGKVSSVKV